MSHFFVIVLVSLLLFLHLPHLVSSFILRSSSYSWSQPCSCSSLSSSKVKVSLLSSASLGSTLGLDVIESTSDEELLEIIEFLPPSFQMKNIQGCWQVKRTLLEPQWTKYSKALELTKFNFLNKKRDKNKTLGEKRTTTTKSNQKQNRNFQIFKEEKFINLSEYWGSSFYATAAGTYTIVEKQKETSPFSQASNKKKKMKSPPLQLIARVTRVDVHLWGFRLKLNIQGNGIVNALYCKNDLRVFRNEDGAIAIQELCRDGIPEEYTSLFDIYFKE